MRSRLLQLTMDRITYVSLIDARRVAPYRAAVGRSGRPLLGIMRSNPARHHGERHRPAWRRGHAWARRVAGITHSRLTLLPHSQTAEDRPAPRWHRRLAAGLRTILTTRRTHHDDVPVTTIEMTDPALPRVLPVWMVHCSG